MAVIEVEKVDAVTMLEAVKATMDQVGSRRMEQAERGIDSRELVAAYADLRRLKDYLQRSIGAYRDHVELDFAPADKALLCACCRRAAELADLRLGSCTEPRERGLVEQRRDLLIRWAVDLAEPPLLELALPPLPTTANSALIHGMHTRIHKKIAMTAFAAEPNPYVGPLQSLHSDLFGPEPAADSLGAESSGTPPPGAGESADLETPRLSSSGSSPAKTGRVDAPTQPAGGAQGSPGAATAAEELLPSGETTRLIDANALRDPRLRSIVALDLRAFERALAVNDNRAAAVHLTSVVEGAVLDHALPRAIELGLTGPPDSWDPQDVLLRVLGENCQPRDRAAAFHLFAAANLVHPAQQLRMPIVMTAASLRKNMEFAQLALRAMGFTA